MFKSKDAPRGVYEKLLSSLKSKYSRYIYAAVSDNDFTCFRDNYTEIDLFYIKYWGVTLSYGNRMLEDKSSNPFGGNGSNASGIDDL